MFTKGAGQYWERRTAGARELTQTLLSDVCPTTTFSVFRLQSSPYHSKANMRAFKIQSIFGGALFPPHAIVSHSAVPKTGKVTKRFPAKNAPKAFKN